MKNEFKPEVSALLKSYVYLYIDPRTNTPFYVGKGVGNRAFSHLNDKSDLSLEEEAKCRTIDDIRRAGLEPRIEILRHGLTDDQAALVEAAVIDAFGLSCLTNKIRGYHSNSFGRVSVEEVLLNQTAKPADIQEPSVLIIVNRLYRSDMTPDELYEITRRSWKVGVRREKAAYAFAIYQGIVREVYQVDEWRCAKSSRSTIQTEEGYAHDGRWEFVGSIAPAYLRDRYLRKSVRELLGKASQNPIRYVNC